MRISIITFLIAITSFNVFGQNANELDYENFEHQILLYEPVARQDIDQKSFDYGSMILEETKSATKNSPENFNVADYMNVLSAFLTLKESLSNIELAYQKFEDAEGSCEYIIAFENTFENNPKYAPIRNKFRKKLEECRSEPSRDEVKFDIPEYCRSNKLDLKLVQEIIQINNADQQYRNGNGVPDKQSVSDRKNQLKIDSLYRQYGTYIGRTLVGEKFESVMWAVIQHSNQEMMEKYLPVVHKAVEENELDETPFKMLIDRYYGLKYGYQVFGSQNGFGFDMADEDQRRAIMQKYGIE